MEPHHEHDHPPPLRRLASGNEKPTVSSSQHIAHPYHQQHHRHHHHHLHHPPLPYSQNSSFMHTVSGGGGGDGGDGGNSQLPAQSISLIGSDRTVVGGPPKPKQRRYRATSDQLRELMVLFDENPSPPATELNELANRISMPTQSVVLWFKNRRARVPHKRNGIIAEDSVVHRRDVSNSHDGFMPGSFHPDQPAVSCDQLTSSTAHPTTPIGTGQTFLSPKVPSLRHSVPGGLELKDPSASPTLGTTHEVAATLLGFSQVQVHNTRNATPQGVNISKSRCAADGTIADHALPFHKKICAAETRVSVGFENATEHTGRDRDYAGTSKVGCTFTSHEVVPDIVEVHHRIPFTPRVRGQRLYVTGDKVEVLESTEAPTRAWLPARIVGLVADGETNAAGANGVCRMEAEPLSLGESVAFVANGGALLLTPVTPSENAPAGSMTWKEPVHRPNGTLNDKKQEEGGRLLAVADAVQACVGCPSGNESAMPYSSFSRRFVSPRHSTAQFSSQSPSRANSNILYIVEFGHDLPEHVGSPRTRVLTREVVSGSRVRPQPPSIIRGRVSEGEAWRPYVGQAVEILVGTTWRVAEVRSRVHSKGFQMRQEDGSICWAPLEQLRPIRKWTGGDQWITSTKPPVTLLKQATDYADEEPRLLESDDDGMTPSSSPPTPSFDSGRNTEFGHEMRVRKRRREETSCSHIHVPKNARTASLPGPDGLPSGWRCEKVERAAGILASRVDSFYVAPDGRRHRSLREAKRYAKRNR
jgi:Homeodomain/Methyl-CpG binding domain